MEYMNQKIKSSAKHFLFTLVLCSFNLVFSQQAKEPQYYKNGQNGIQFIAKNNGGTIIVSNFDAKMTIRQDIAKKVYDYYLKNNLKSNTVITIIGIDAKVTGKCVITKRNKLVNLDFYYHKVEWNNGLVEIHQA
jgi:hypothetical protein